DAGDYTYKYWLAFFFFQAEDGIRDFHVTGVQTCALPICKILPTGSRHACISGDKRKAALEETGYQPTAICILFDSDGRMAISHRNHTIGQQHTTERNIDNQAQNQTGYQKADREVPQALVHLRRVL